MRFKWLVYAGALLPVTLIVGSATAQDNYVEMAKAAVKAATQPAPPWTGPTTGPAAVPGKTVIFVNYDQRNSGGRGVGEAAAEAAKIIGWDYRVLDGQGTIQGQTTALNQAIALKPDGIILGSVDATAMNTVIQTAIDAGIKVVSWHSGMTPGKLEGSNIIVNVTSDPAAIGKLAGLYAVADSEGKAGAVLFTDSAYAITIAKTNAEKAAIEACSGCKVLEVADTPLGDVQNRIPQLTSSLLQKYGNQWTHSVAINDLYYDFMASALDTAGIAGDAAPRNISAGDGSEAAFQRIADKDHQIGTVAEPLRLHAFQLIDDLNRVFAGEPSSDYIFPVHLFTPENVSKDRGAGGIFDPDNGYEQVFRKIWGK